MHGVVRQYQNAAELVAIVQQHKSEIEQVMKQVPGFIAWTLTKSTDGNYSTITVCNDQAGCLKSMEVAREFLSKHASGIRPPQVTEFEVLERIVGR